VLMACSHLRLVPTCVQTVQLALLGGHHRIAAMIKFDELWRTKKEFDWENSTWNLGGGKLRRILGREVKVSLLYLGSKPTLAFLGRVASSLNQLNDRAHQTTFHDALTQIHLLRCVYRSCRHPKW